MPGPEASQRPQLLRWPIQTLDGFLLADKNPTRANTDGPSGLRTVGRRTGGRPCGQPLRVTLPYVPVYCGSQVAPRLRSTTAGEWASSAVAGRQLVSWPGVQSPARGCMRSGTRALSGRPVLQPAWLAQAERVRGPQMAVMMEARKIGEIGEIDDVEEQNDTRRSPLPGRT
jgi:hypothetical protein